MEHSEVLRDKYEAYRKTEYRFTHGVKCVTLRIGEVSRDLIDVYFETGYSCGVFITAYNPFGQPRESRDNEAAHERLRDELAALTFCVNEGAGADPSGEWPEEKSLFALGVSLGEAQRIGRKYRQDAIVWVGPDALSQLVLLR